MAASRRSTALTAAAAGGASARESSERGPSSSAPTDAARSESSGRREAAHGSSKETDTRALSAVQATVSARRDERDTPGGARASWPIDCGAAAPGRVPASAGPSVGAVAVSPNFSSAPTAAMAGSASTKESSGRGPSPAASPDPARSGGSGKRGAAHGSSEETDTPALSAVQATVSARRDERDTPGGARASWPIDCGAAAPDRAPALAGPSVRAGMASPNFSSAPTAAMASSISTKESSGRGPSPAASPDPARSGGSGKRGAAHGSSEETDTRALLAVQATVSARRDERDTPGGARASWPIDCGAAAPDRAPALAGPSVRAGMASPNFSSAPTAAMASSISTKESSGRGPSPAASPDPARSGGSGKRGAAHGSSEETDTRALLAVQATVLAGRDERDTPGGAQASWPIDCGAAAPGRVPALAGPSVGAVAVSPNFSSAPTSAMAGSASTKESSGRGPSLAASPDPARSGGSGKRGAAHGSSEETDTPAL